MITSIQAILFDLDGTLLDTAPEFTFCVNQLLQEEGYPLQPVEKVRASISFGSAGVIQQAFGLTTADLRFDTLNQRLLALYREHLGSHTAYFAGIVELLTYLTTHWIPWGIVTNKPSIYVTPLVQQFNALATAGCVISGDTFAVSKPHPLPLLKACEQLHISPEHCLYIGDAKTDVQASIAAGMSCAVAHYGYIPTNENPHDWNGNYALKHPLEVIALLNT